MKLPCMCELMCVQHAVRGTGSIPLALDALQPSKRMLAALQVFISEQVLYTDKELKQHGRAGDVTGALAESGFQARCAGPACNETTS